MENLKQEIIDLASSGGLSQIDIAKEVKCSRAYVSQVLLKYKPKIANKLKEYQRKEKEKKEEEIVELLKEGHSTYKIAENLNISRNTVSKIRNKHNIDRYKIEPRKSPVPGTKTDNIINLFDDGKSCEEIAEIINTSKQFVYKTVYRWRDGFSDRKKA